MLNVLELGNIKGYRSEIKIDLIIMMTLFYLNRVVIPVFKYPFIILFIFILLDILVCYKNTIFSNLKRTFKEYYVILLLFFLVFISVFYSYKIYVIIVKDILNVIILLCIFLFLTQIVQTQEQLGLFIKKLTNQVILFSGVIFFARTLSLFNLGFDLNMAQIDYNFALLPTFYGFVGITFFYMRNNISTRCRILYPIVQCFFLLQILMSGSRRGIVMLIVLVVTIIILHFILKKRIQLAARTVYITALFCVALFLLLLFVVTPKFRNQVFNKFDIENVKLTSNLYRFVSVIDKTVTYKDVYEDLWVPEFDPNDPDSGWGKRIHVTLSPLSGTNVEIVPEGAKGYYMDSSCNADCYLNNAHSFTRLFINDVSFNDVVTTSVYCYVSPEFNGEWVRLYLEGSLKVCKHSYIDYDLNKKGSWQKLNLSEECNIGKVSVLLYFAKYNAVDFSNLKGYVIFAYPEYSKISPKETQDNILKVNASMFDFGLLYKFIKNQKINGDDLIRKVVTNIVSEDTTYYPYKADLQIDTVYSKFTGPRLNRWRFAWQIYTKEYNWSEKIFGGGFDFLNWYGYYFLKDKTKSDYPHNPFLHVLLYSGIIGLAIYIYFMYKVFYYYIKYRKEYYIFFIFFLITFFFTFFSGGSPFDPPIMGFFVILPFFIHSIHKKEEKLKEIKKQLPKTDDSVID